MPSAWWMLENNLLGWMMPMGHINREKMECELFEFAGPALDAIARAMLPEPQRS
jgi:hypothetical protein